MYKVLCDDVPPSEAFATVKDDWQRLFAVAAASPFLSWEWMSTWFKNFGENKVPLLFKVYHDDTLIGILPTFLESKTVLGMKFNRLALMGEDVGGADYLDIICRPADAATASTAIFQHLNRPDIKNRFDVICLKNLSGRSVTVNLLKDLYEQENVKYDRCSVSVAAVCRQIDLTLGWEVIIKRSKFANRFKQNLKKLEKMPGFEFCSATEPSELEKAFERFLYLHEKRWQTAGGSELSGHPRLISFQRQLMSALASSGLIRFDELWVDGKCRSSTYGLDDGKIFYCYNVGYDLDFSHLSVGTIALGLSVLSALKRGNVSYDFLRGDEKYKSYWSNSHTELLNLSFSRNTLPVFAHEALGYGFSGLKNLGKFVLPASIAESVGNWQRSNKRSYQLSGQ